MLAVCKHPGWFVETHARRRTIDGRQATASRPGIRPGGAGAGRVAFGARLRSARKQSGLSVREFSRRVDVKSHSNLSRAERGLFKPSRAVVKRIEALTGVHLLDSYDALEAEWQAKAEARKRRRWELARQEARPDRRSAGREEANPQNARYRDDAALEPQAGVPTGQESNANRREAVKTIGALILDGAARAKRLLRAAESSNVGPLTLDEYDETVDRLTRTGNIRPPIALLDEADTIAKEIADLLWQGRHSGQQRIRLELLIGQLSYLQGHFVFKVGDYGAAAMHLRVARHYGEQLGNHLLLASVADMESYIALYQGRHEKALRIIREAQQYATEHTAARLATVEARALAGRGSASRQEVSELLERAERTLPTQPSFEAGASSPFGPEMFQLYAATAAVRADDERGEEFAREAVRQYEALETLKGERSHFQHLALARLDLALALIRRKRPEPREAARLAIQALATPRHLQTDTVRRRVNELLQAFWSNPAWRTLPAVRELAEAARGYRPPALPAPQARRALGGA